MRKYLLTLLLALPILLTFSPFARAQDQTTAEESMSAVLKFFGSGMGAALYHSADIHDALGFDVGISGAIAVVPDEFKSLPVVVDDKITIGYLHANLGIGANIELTGRVLFFDFAGDLTDPAPNVPTTKDNLTLFSIGVKYGLLQMPALPKIAAHVSGHFVGLPSEFDYGSVNGISAKVIASHSIAILGFYVGAGIDYSRAKIDDTFPIPELAGKSFNETGFLFNFGAEATVFPLIKVNAGANFGEYNSYDLGIDISIR